MRQPMNAVNSAVNSAAQTDCTIGRSSILYLCAFSVALLLAIVDTSFARAPKTAKIAFSSNRDGAWDIFMMNPDGSKQVNLTRDHANNFSPTWSPTGEHILFVSERGGPADLYLMDADGSNVRPVFRKKARRIEPTWSPDGQMIAYHSETPRWSIRIAAVHGINSKQIAVADPRGGNPSWSADGNEIAFVDNIGGSRRIRIVKVRSGAIRTFLPHQSPWMYTPAWAPEGDRLAFSWYKWGIGGKEAIYVAERDGRNLKQIGKAELGTFSPAWAPEGDSLVYVEEAKDGDRQIVTINLRTGTKKRLTRRGLNITPAWFDPRTVPVAPQPQLLTTVWGQMKVWD